jgi:serine/threonine-protein kinase RsbW
MPTVEFKLGVPSATEHQAMIRSFMGHALEKAGFDEMEINMLVLAVDEAVANVNEHAYGDQATNEKEVRVRVVVEPEQVRIEIEDTGKGFDPSKVKQEDLEQLVAERKSGGLGLRLIQKIMDDVQYQIVPGEKNELRMVKRRVAR